MVGPANTETYTCHLRFRVHAHALYKCVTPTHLYRCNKVGVRLFDPTVSVVNWRNTKQGMLQSHSATDGIDEVACRATAAIAKIRDPQNELRNTIFRLQVQWSTSLLRQNVLTWENSVAPESDPHMTTSLIQLHTSSPLVQ